LPNSFQTKNPKAIATKLKISDENRASVSIWIAYFCGLANSEERRSDRMEKFGSHPVWISFIYCGDG